MRGEVVGILISQLENGSGCFVLPIEAIEKVHKDFLRFGEVRPGWIGVTIATAEKESTDVRVDDLAEDAPASKAGMKKGDVLVQVGATKIKSTEDVLNASFYLTAGDEVPVTVLRGGETLTLKVEPVAHPSSKRDTMQALSPSPFDSGILTKAEK
jgi:serine protease Do